jgi:hypothetical protein
MGRNAMAFILISIVSGCAAQRDPQALHPLPIYGQVPVNGVPTLSTASISVREHGGRRLVAEGRCDDRCL